MSYCRVDSRGRVTRSSSTLSGLGKFSLKRAFRIPKGVRKFQPGIYIKKHPLILAPLLLIPGAAPLVARGVMGAGKLAVRGGRGLFRGAAGLLKRAKPGNDYNLAEKEARNSFAPLPALRSIPAETAPTSYGPMAPVESPMAMAAGGGGGAPSGNYGDTPSAAAPPEAAAPSQAGMGVGALAIGGLVLFGLMAASRKRR